MSNSKERPVSKNLIAAIEEAVKKETGSALKPSVGTGHVKWPPLPDEPVVDKMILVVEHNNLPANPGDPENTKG